MKDKVKAVALQIEVEWLNPEANLARIESSIAKVAASVKPDIVVLLELCSSGYVIGRERKDDFAKFARDYLKAGQKVPGPFTESLGQMAKKYNTYIVAGILEDHPIVPATLYNSAVLLEPKGSIIGVHRKAHIPGEEKHYFYPGSSIEVFPTELGNIGLCICSDSVYPEFCRVLALKGAEIICITYARPAGTTPDPENCFRLVATRAYENNVFIISCNRVGREGSIIFNGRSCICGPRGDFLARSEVETEDMISAELVAADLETARMVYSRFRDRRPDLYEILSQPL